MYWTLAGAWYFSGWWFAQHVWRKRFNLDIQDAIFITVFSIGGPFMGAVWLFSLWLDSRPKKPPRLRKPYVPREPIVLLRKHSRSVEEPKE